MLSFSAVHLFSNAHMFPSQAQMNSLDSFIYSRFDPSHFPLLSRVVISAVNLFLTIRRHLAWCMLVVEMYIVVKVLTDPTSGSAFDAHLQPLSHFHTFFQKNVHNNIGFGQLL